MHPNDTTEVERCCRALAPGLVLYASQWLDAQAAEDAVQEAFVALLAGRRRPDNLKAWLFRCVRNEAMERLRRLRRQRGYEEKLGRGRPWFEPRADEALDAAAAEAALRQLPEGQREIIVLRLWAGMTLEEASKATGLPVSTLFSRYEVGLAALRRMLGGAQR
jgi:RNA polymerase sigma-70 factor (ECF subfamily)